MSSGVMSGAGRFSLENEHVSVRFDESTGALIGLMNKKTGWEVIRQPALAMGIRLLVPVENHRDNRAESPRQMLSGWKRTDGDGAELRWDTVECSHSGEMDISVILTVSLEGASVRFQTSIDNRSNRVVEEVWGPTLGGLREPPGEPRLESWSLNMCGGFSRDVLGDGFPQRCGYYGTDYPTFIRTFPGPDTQTSFVLLTNGLQGIYFGMHDEALNIVNFVHELRPGYLDSLNQTVPGTDEVGTRPAGFVVSAVRLPFIEPGEHMTLAPMVVSLFKGTWHSGIAPYTDWRKSWFVPTPWPEWRDTVDCWLTLQMNTPEGDCRYRYSDLADIAREAAEKGVGALQLIGWQRGGQDGAEPYQDTDPRLGTREELKDAIREIEGLGVHVLLMCKFLWADRSTPEFDSELAPLTLRDMYGNYTQFDGYSYQSMTQHMRGGSRRSGAGMCHLSDAYRRLALREFEKILDLGSSGILYDELNTDMLLCFDTSHGHRRGESNLKGSLLLAREFSHRARNARSAFLMTGEGPNDHLSQYYPLSYVRTWNGEWGGLSEADHLPGWRFMNPDMRFATCITGWNDREMVNQCLVYGYTMNYEPYNFKGRLSDFPETVAYGMKAQRLRRRLWNYIWNGRFRHTLGARVHPRSARPNYIYSVFEDPEQHRRAIAIANQNAIHALKVEVILEGGAAEFDVYDVENERVARSHGTVSIGSRSLKILVER